jgi:hypothetical protein
MLQLEERERELTHELEATQQEADPLQRQVQLLRVMGAMTARKERLQMVIFFMQGEAGSSRAAVHQLLGACRRHAGPCH